MRWYPCFLHLFTLCLILPSCFKCGVIVNSTVKCISKERDALLDFKRGFKANDCFASWDDQDRQSDCCKWEGVECDNHTSHIISLQLGGCSDYGSLEGNLSSSLVELEHLKSSEYGSLEGNLSSSLVELEHLKSLVLGGNGLSQNIPSFIGFLVNLQQLDLSYNSFYGHIPHQLSNLSKLTSLDLRGNGLSNNIPSFIGFLVNLQELDLSYNSFYGHIPHQLSNLSKLTSLDLSFNGITGPIPDVVGNLHSLSSLILHHNALEGVVPASLFNLTFLEYLDVANNSLQEIQNWNSSGSLCKLQELHLWGNNISSKFSSLLQGFSGCVHKSLVYLDASENRFWGSIPNEIATFSSLKMLDLGNNQLNGRISSSLRLLSVLERLDLRYNALKGEFSNHHLSNLSRLTQVDLSDNPGLVVSIPANWVPPFQVTYLDLSSCKLGPQFPKWFQNQTELNWLDISNTGIFDTIPAALWNMLSPNLNNLYLSHNEIYGILPNLSRNFTSESYLVLDLSSNHMEGAIPSFIGNVAELYLNNNNFSGSIAPLCQKTKANLQVLDASNNFFSGKLPDCWENFQYLQVLRLDHNNFSGKLPTSIGSLGQLTWLSMRNNRFHGELQMLSAKNLSLLTVLDLGYNSFTGHIPEGIWGEGIVVLGLRKNKLSGRLPPSLCKMTELGVLDLSLNQLSGSLPECICNLKAMQYSADVDHVNPILFRNKTFSDMIMWKREEQSFNDNLQLQLLRSIAISDNKLEGNIPNGISCLKGLISLDLARNKLAGSIPPKIGELTSLELLDLSSNHFSGQIPSSLADLNFLGVLNLSYNKLSGMIPTGTQIQQMDPASYMGNPGLCGLPLPKCSNDPTAFSNVPRGPSMTPDEENKRKNVHIELYISVVVGFIIGFWGVCGTLVIKRSWRHTYFRFVEDIYDRVYVMVAVTTARVWKGQ